MSLEGYNLVSNVSLSVYVCTLCEYKQLCQRLLILLLWEKRILQPNFTH